MNAKYSKTDEELKAENKLSNAQHATAMAEESHLRYLAWVINNKTPRLTEDYAEVSAQTVTSYIGWSDVDAIHAMRYEKRSEHFTTLFTAQQRLVLSEALVKIPLFMRELAEAFDLLQIKRFVGSVDHLRENFAVLETARLELLSDQIT